MVELKTRRSSPRGYALFNGTSRVGDIIRYNRRQWGFKLEGIYYRAGVPNRKSGTVIGPLQTKMCDAVRVAAEILERMEKE